MPLSYHYNRPIYPVPVKPRGLAGKPIVTWDCWPDDVRDVLHAWNKGRLSFRGDGYTFKCARCEAYCEGDGLACVFDGAEYCDECMVEMARADEEGRIRREHYGEHRSAGVERGSCICVMDPERQREGGGWDRSINPACTYHAAAAKFPLDHSIPWNCPTYWDGCNCDRVPPKTR